MASWIDEYQRMVTDCQARSTKMNDWERGFIQTIKQLLQKHLPPSARQLEKLDQIWQRVTDHGFTPKGTT